MEHLFEGGFREVEIHKIIVADHTVTEPVGSHGEFDRHPKRAAHRSADTVHCLIHRHGAANSLQEVMHYCPLIVVRHDPFGFSKDVACKPGRQQQVDDGVVEAQHGVMKLHDDQVLIVARITNDSRVCACHAGDIEVRLDAHTSILAIVAGSTGAETSVRAYLELDCSGGDR